MRVENFVSQIHVRDFPQTCFRPVCTEVNILRKICPIPSPVWLTEGAFKFVRGSASFSFLEKMTKGRARNPRREYFCQNADRHSLYLLRMMSRFWPSVEGRIPMRLFKFRYCMLMIPLNVFAKWYPSATDNPIFRKFRLISITLVC